MVGVREGGRVGNGLNGVEVNGSEWNGMELNGLINAYVMIGNAWIIPGQCLCNA